MINEMIRVNSFRIQKTNLIWFLKPRVSGGHYQGIIIKADNKNIQQRYFSQAQILK